MTLYTKTVEGRGIIVDISDEIINTYKDREDILTFLFLINTKTSFVTLITNN